MDLQKLFENGPLTFEEFEAAVKRNGIKLVDLSKGDYVSKRKYDDDLTAKANEIETLNGTISQRDTDLEGLKIKLTEAGNDTMKLSQLTNDFTALQSKYDDDVKNYKAQLKKQAYEFAVKDFASTKKFTSKAAKRDFINSMISADLKMTDAGILGCDDFVKQYTDNNADAFVIEHEEVEEPKPIFVSPAVQDVAQQAELFNFNFVGVRPHDE